jgi:hypothetical protein
VKGVASRIEMETPDGMICRVWCGLHQLDLIMQRLLKDICDEEFYRELNSVIGHLRRQTNLIESMGCKCPTVSGTRWLSAGVVTDWLSVNRGTLIEHYSRKPERLRPSRKRWLITMLYRVSCAKLTLLYKDSRASPHCCRSRLRRFPCWHGNKTHGTDCVPPQCGCECH